jgi:hypothetical protein
LHSNTKPKNLGEPLQILETSLGFGIFGADWE